MSLPVTPSFRLDGKRALITGGGRGIGLAAAAALAEYGAAVTICARNGAELDEAVAALRERGATATALGLDVTNTAALKAAIEAADPFDIPAGSPLGQSIVRPLCLNLVKTWTKELEKITIEDLCLRARERGIESVAAITADFSI